MIPNTLKLALAALLTVSALTARPAAADALENYRQIENTFCFNYDAGVGYLNAALTCFNSRRFTASRDYYKLGAACLKKGSSQLAFLIENRKGTLHELPTTLVRELGWSTVGQSYQLLKDFLFQCGCSCE